MYPVSNIDPIQALCELEKYEEAASAVENARIKEPQNREINQLQRSINVALSKHKQAERDCFSGIFRDRKFVVYFRCFAQYYTTSQKTFKLLHFIYRARYVEQATEQAKSDDNEIQISKRALVARMLEENVELGLDEAKTMFTHTSFPHILSYWVQNGTQALKTDDRQAKILQSV